MSRILCAEQVGGAVIMSLRAQGQGCVFPYLAGSALKVGVEDDATPTLINAATART